MPPVREQSWEMVSPPRQEVREVLRAAGYPGSRVGFDAVRTVAGRVKRQSDMRAGNVTEAFRAFLPLLYPDGCGDGTVLSREQLEHIFHCVGDEIDEADLQELLNTVVPFGSDGKTDVCNMVSKVMAVDKQQ